MVHFHKYYGHFFCFLESEKINSQGLPIKPNLNLKPALPMNIEEHAPKIPVIIAEEHSPFSRHLKEKLRKNKELLLNEANSPKAVLDLLTSHPAAVILLDEGIPGGMLDDFLKEVNKRFTGAKIILTSLTINTALANKVIDKAAAAYILKSAGRKEIEKAIEAGRKGDSYLSKEIMEETLFKKRETGALIIGGIEFTERERDVLFEMIRGKDVVQISDKINLSQPTVYTYRTGVFIKTKTKNEAELLIWALKNKVVGVDDVVKW